MWCAPCPALLIADAARNQEMMKGTPLCSDKRKERWKRMTQNDIRGTSMMIHGSKTYGDLSCNNNTNIIQRAAAKGKRVVVLAHMDRS